MIKKLLLAILCCSVGYNTYAQQVQYTQIFDKDIKTVQINVDGYDFSNPVILLNGEEVLKISFDELSHEIKNYSYKIEHCNANWTASNISEFEYVDGINWVEIIDYQTSINTTFNYTHYTFYFPNEQIKAKLSGNYIISVYEEEAPEQACFKARFSIVEQRTNIVPFIRTNTDLGARSKYQQVEFDLFKNEYQIADPFSELTVCIMQNGRTDNQVTGIKPTIVSNNKLSYTNNRSTVFEAANEYRSLEISNIRILDDNVSDIKYFDPYYHVEMFGDKPRNNKPYNDVNDVNGKYIVNLQRNNYDKELEADYLFVHFSYPSDPPYFDGSMYLVGGFNAQLISNESRMQYMNSTKDYQQTLLLKQGGYNYQYLFLPKGATKATTERTEGNFWETENEYEIFVYHRPVGARYDRLIGYKIVNSRQ